MPAAYTQAQRAAIAQFMSFTATKEATAAKQLKANGWNVEQAVDAHFHKSASTTKSSTTSSLTKLFDKYRDDPVESPDAIGTSGTMNYLTDLGVALDEPAVLAILTEVNAPTMGELTRDDFIEGWKALGADTLAKQQVTLDQLRSRLSQQPAYFRRVYKHSFLLARMPGQRGVQLESAIDFWRLLFGPGGMKWKDPETDWLELWSEYLQEKWKKGVNKDMWDQTVVFATKCLEDPTMSWWSEDGAWPGVLDDFVTYVKEKRGNTGGVGDGGDAMNLG